MMKASNFILNKIAKSEGFRSAPYLDPVGVPTIGYGTTFYENGKRVTMQDQPISEERAWEILSFVANGFLAQIKTLVKVELNQDQLDALLSFVYNLGIGAFSRSTLLKKINLNPNDPTISNEFKRWVYAGGSVLPGLVKRRAEEAALYFKKKM